MVAVHLLLQEDTLIKRSRMVLVRINRTNIGQVIKNWQKLKSGWIDFSCSYICVPVRDRSGFCFPVYQLMCYLPYGNVY